MADDTTTDEHYDTELKEVGRRVRALRDERDWGAGTLANRAGLHWTYIREIEQGKRNVSVVTLLKLAHGLGVDPCELLPSSSAPTTPGKARRRS